MKMSSNTQKTQERRRLLLLLLLCGDLLLDFFDWKHTFIFSTNQLQELPGIFSALSSYLDINIASPSLSGEATSIL